MRKLFHVGAIALMALAGAAQAADMTKAPPGGDYKAVSELTTLPEFIPGMGALFVRPKTMPVGPYLSYDRRGNLVATIYMVPLAELQNKEEFDDLDVGTEKVVHVDFYYNAGHPGVEEPHYHVTLWHVDPDDINLD